MKRNKLALSIFKISFVIVAACSLQACVELAIGSAVMGGFAAADRRTLGAQTDDKAISLKGESRLAKVFGNNAHVNVNAYNRRVLLTGEVANENDRQTAEREVKAIDGVAGVINELVIAPISDLGSRSNDTYLTARVRAALIDTDNLSASAFKITTEAGVTFLMGRVTQQEGQIAAGVASRVAGVRKVVKVLEYLTDEEYREITRSNKK